MGEDMRRSLTLVQLIAISFFTVSTSFSGQEEAMGAGGCLLTCLTTLTVPIFYALPSALISSEQATHLPGCGGAVGWGIVLGRPMALVNFYVRWASAMFDNAIYPVTVFTCLSAVVPAVQRWYWRVAITSGTITAAVTCNYFGIDAVGWSSVFLAFFIIAPYAAFTVMALPHVKWQHIIAGYPQSLGRPHIARLLATMVWQFSGFDSVGALSGECANPRRDFPLAMFSIVALSTLQYLAVTVAGLSVEPDVAAWSCGGFARNAGKLFGGQWLGFAISAAGALSAASLMNVTLSTSGREMWAGSVLNAFPCAPFFARMRPNWKNDPLPIRSICYMACIILPLQFMSFGFLVDWSAFLGALAQMIQTVIFFALRSPAWMARARRETGWELLEARDVRDDEKFVIPGGWPVAIVVGSSLFGSCGLLMIVTGWEAMLATVAFMGIMFGINVIDYRIRREPWVARQAPERRMEWSTTMLHRGPSIIIEKC